MKVCTEYESDNGTSLRRIRVEIDECPLNPLVEFENFFSFWMEGRNWEIKSPGACPPIDTDENGKTVYRDDLYILPVYAYEHGGIAFSLAGFSCPWDSGVAGFLYCEKSALAGITDEKAREIARAELEEVQNWANGEVYYWTEE